MFTTTYPNKVFDYMAAGRATVLAIDGVIREAVEKANAGVFVPPGNPQALADAIRRCHDYSAETRQMGTNGREYVERFFNRDIQAEQFVDLLVRLAQRLPLPIASCEPVVCSRQPRSSNLQLARNNPPAALQPQTTAP
jgi:glycosyltransferase involved in cell wall biosynthesis